MDDNAERLRINKVLKKARVLARDRFNTDKAIKRAEKIAVMYIDGGSAQAIAPHFKLTWQRINQILHDIGITFRDTRRHQATRQRQITNAKSAKIWRQSKEHMFGCSHQEYLEYLKLYNKQGRRLIALYRQSYISAVRRGIKWRLNFKQWLTVWRKSGKINQTGKRAGEYLLGRINHSKGYMPGNIRVMESTTMHSNVKH